MVESQAPGPEGRLPRGRFWTAIVVGVLLAATFVLLMESFFAGRARTTWPAYAIVLPLAAAAAVLIGRSHWVRAAGAILGGGLTAVAAAAVVWFVLLSTMAGCGLQLEDVSWTEPGLYAHVDSGSFQPLYFGAEWSPPAGALPFAARFPGQPDVDLAVSLVSWSGFNDGRDDWIGFQLSRDGVVSGGASERVDNATLVRGFLAFTANVTDATAAQRIVWADEFQRTRRLEYTEYPDQQAVDEERGVGFYSHEVRIAGPFRLEALANETGAHWSLQSTRQVGTAYADGGAYSWQLAMATWSVPVPHGSRGATLVIDPLDRVRFDGSFRDGTEGDEAKAAIRKAMREDGLPEPTFQDYEASGSIC